MFETVLGRQSKQDIDVGESGIRIENAHARSRFRKRNTEINRDARLSDSAFTASDSDDMGGSRLFRQNRFLYDRHCTNSPNRAISRDSLSPPFRLLYMFLVPFS